MARRRRSARFRLTALYCCVFFPSGVALVFITYVVIVVAQSPSFGATRVNIDHRSLDAGEFLIASCILLVALVGASVLIGWLVAGRVLRPLRVMTAATRQISERNLHERLALAGPDDELKNLGDTIDSLLARLESAFDSQRRFIASASHELRTPLMLSQTLLQVALADPDITLDSLRATCQEVIDADKYQARLIDALLTLARSQRGLDRREPVDLTAVVNDALDAYQPSAAARGLHVDATLDKATMPGDARLVSRLVANLVDNAIRYNITGGRVAVKLAASTTRTTLTVTNTGAVVPPLQASRLLEPFQRAAPDRTASPDGLGLGLSIVADIAKAHGADLELPPQPEGGLAVTVSFPAWEGPVDRADEGGSSGRCEIYRASGNWTARRCWRRSAREPSATRSRR
jgi:signal transduction histidine kinase